MSRPDRLHLLLALGLASATVVLLLSFRSLDQTPDSLAYAVSVKTGRGLFHAHHLLFSPIVRLNYLLLSVFDEATEIFCTGTAWTVQHVRELDYCDRVHKFETRQLQQALLEELRGIQLGEREDRFDWVTEVP